MKRDRIRFLRNIGIAAHIDAGKTTLTERILYFTGKSHRMGETHTGDSQMDTMKQEIEKGITISSAATHTEWQHRDIPYDLNIIDTPGHVDFTIEVERSLRVLDGVVALFDAVAGVETQSETVWQQASRYDIPLIAMVNKMDRPGADYFAVIQEIRERLGGNAIALQVPIGAEETFAGVVNLIELQALYWTEEGEVIREEEIPESLLQEVEEHRNKLLESIALFDEDLLDQYLEDPDSVQVGQWHAVLRKATLSRKIVPVLMGAAYKNKGVQPLLDAICDYLPSPLDRGAIEGQSLKTEDLVYREPDEAAPFAALAFKLLLDQQNRQLCFFRIYSGKLQRGEQVLNPRTGKKERIARLYLMHANKREEIQTASAGDIVATLGLKDIRTGDTLCAKDKPLVLESLYVPPPVINMAVEARTKEQMDKMGMAFAKLQLEDPSFKVETDPDTGQTIIKGMGELHLEIIIDKLKEDFGIEVNVGSPRVSYQERFTKMVPYRHRLKKQTGGRGLFAEIEANIGPVDAEFLDSESFRQKGERLQFVNKIVGGSIPKEFISAIKEGFRKELSVGPLGGFPIQSLKVALIDGLTHKEDSNALAFEICAVEMFRSIAPQLAPQLMEPVVSVRIMTPNEYVGNILSGLNRRRGIILSQEMQHQHIQLNAEVPLAEMFGYINHLRTVSAGRATFSMAFKDYAPVPDDIAKAVLGRGY